MDAGGGAGPSHPPDGQHLRERKPSALNRKNIYFKKMLFLNLDVFVPK